VYRVLRPLSTGHKVGDLLFKEDLEKISVGPLVEANAISEVRCPPLSVLPGWEERAEVLKRYNIVKADEFVEACDTLLRFIFRQPPRVIRNWKEEVIELIK